LHPAGVPRTYTTDQRHQRILTCLAATTQISQHPGSQPHRLSAGRLVSSTGPVRYLYEQQLSTSLREASLQNHHSSTRSFSRQGHTTVCGCNRRTNRLRRCERQFHKEKAAFKHPFIKCWSDDYAVRRGRGRFSKCVAANWAVPRVSAGSRRTPTRFTPGATSLRSSSHFALML